MKKILSVIIYSIILLLFIECKAYANIAPLKVKTDGVEPLENPGVSIESAEITVKPEENGFKFNCNYVLKGLQDGENITIGIPGDLGYTLEAGYIEGMNVILNGRPVKYKVYNTTPHLSETWKNYNSPLNFKWHTFTIPVKKDVSVAISVSYNIFWRILDQNKNSPYHIVPFLLSTNKLFGNNIGSYSIKYISDDIISLPDVKVMINSMLESNIISPAILSPKWSDTEIVWNFKNAGEFQDFRLISLSYRKLALEFSTWTSAENQSVNDSIKWAILNNNYDKLSEIFEKIAKQEIKLELSDDTGSALGTAAYLSSEFYVRQKEYDKAIEMLSLPDKTNLWPVSIKYQYTHALKLKDAKDYIPLLDELKKLHQHKDFILAADFAGKLIEPVNQEVIKEEIVKKQVEEQRKLEEQKKTEQPAAPRKDKNNIVYYLAGALLLLLVILSYTLYKSKMKK